MKKAPIFLFALLHLILVCQAFSQSPPPPRIEKVSLYRFEEGMPVRAVLIPLDRQEMYETNNIEHGNHIVFTIPGIEKYLSERRTARQKINLLINDIVLQELPAYLLFSDSSKLIFSFDLGKISSKNRKLLYQIPGTHEKSAFVGLAFDTNTRLYFDEPVSILFNKHKTSKIWRWVFLAVPLGLLVMILFSNSILKDSVARLVGPTGNEKEKEKEKDNTSYSFSKTQFAFWTLIVGISFVYIWWVTLDFGTLNTTALALLGISSATIITSSLIGRSEENRALATDEMNSGDAKSQSEKEIQEKERTDRINSLIKFRHREKGSKMESFFFDILSDTDGISVHRLQSFAFNLIFAFIFIQQVLTTYSMPEFSDTHFVLLGLSNGTYAFIKAREN